MLFLTINIALIIIILFAAIIRISNEWQW